MPIKYKIFQNRKLVYALGNGKITFDELLQHIEELAADPQYKPPMKKIVDYRNATLFGLSIEEANKFTIKKVQLVEIFNNETCAFVMNSDLDFGMSRAHEAHFENSDITTNVFRNMEEALSWLQVDLDKDEMNLG